MDKRYTVNPDGKLFDTKDGVRYIGKLEERTEGWRACFPNVGFLGALTRAEAIDVLIKRSQRPVFIVHPEAILVRPRVAHKGDVTNALRKLRGKTVRNAP